MTSALIARSYSKAIESRDFEQVRRLLHPEIRQTEWPNKIVPNGITRTLAQVEEGFAKGLKVVSKQAYEITNIIAIAWRWRQSGAVRSPLMSER